MPRLTWKSDGGCADSSVGAQFCLKARIGYPGSRVTDVIIGGTRIQLANQVIRSATLELFDERPRVDPEALGSPLQYVSHGKGFVTVKHPGFVPFVVKEREWLKMEIFRRIRRPRKIVNV